MNRAEHLSRWRELAGAAFSTAADPALGASGLAEMANTARERWISPFDGKADGWLVHALLDACKAYGMAQSIRQRGHMAALVQEASVTFMTRLEAAGPEVPPEPVQPRLRFRADIDG